MKALRKIKKHPYVLLELLIAIALLSFFLGPLLTTPFSLMQKQKKEAAHLERHLEGERLLIRVEELLRQGIIPWETVVKGASEKTLIDFLSNKEKGIYVYLKQTVLHKTADENPIALITVEVLFQEKRKNKILYKTSGSFFLTKKLLAPQEEVRHLS